MAGRRDLLLRQTRPDDRQRAARVPALLRGVSGPAGEARRRQLRSPSRTGWISPCSALPCAGTDGQLTLRRSGLPAPLHLARALAEYRPLPPAERLKAAAAMAALRFAGSVPTIDDISFGEWLARHSQDENSRRLLWDLLSVAALGLPADEADLLADGRCAQDRGALRARQRGHRRSRRSAQQAAFRARPRRCSPASGHASCSE